MTIVQKYTSLRIKVLFILSFLMILIWGYAHTRYEELNYEFTGIVTDVTYTEKGFPEIHIKNKTYSFGNPYFLRYTNLIHLGDSLIKKKGSFEIKIIKPIGKVIEPLER